jgi:N6-adenosine-specific RNA methylase IME4
MKMSLEGWWSGEREPLQAPVLRDTQELFDLAASGMKFGCVYADPPWLYNNQVTRASTSNHYDGMTVEELCKLPIRDLCADDAHLHLWITNAFLFDAPKIFAAWGFEFKSTFIWVKPQMGIGNYWRNSHEQMLTAVRGDATRFDDHAMMSWTKIDRGAHSAKPEQVRNMIKRVSEGPYLELFGRRSVPGWHVFGNQINE